MLGAVTKVAARVTSVLASPMAMLTPLMDTTRARTELGWRETRRGDEAFAEVMHGIGDGAGDRTVPLHPRHEPVAAAR